MKNKIICPKCNEEIEQLIFSARQLKSGYVYLDGGLIYDEDIDMEREMDDLEFLCPNCDELLFTDKEEAQSFLEGKDELEMLVEKKVKEITDEKIQNKN